MPSRNRTRNSDLETGQILNADGSVTNSSRWNVTEECTDVVGDMFDSNGLIKDHTFDLKKTTHKGHTTDGVRNAGAINQAIFLNKINAIPSGGSPLIISSSEKEQFRVRLLSSTGPLTPKVNLPLFIFELKDIPMMLKHAGDLLHKIRSPSGLSPHKEAAAATLAYQFGWAPLIGDLMKLTQFAELTKRRQQELSKANSQRGSMRRMSFPDKKDVVVEDNKLLISDCGLVYGSITKTRITKSWATCRWKARGGQMIGKEPSHNEAFRSALGLNLGMIPITIWKALPWSWMIDWFADISNVMQANYNMIFYSPSAINFMENRVVITETSGGSNASGNTSATVSAGSLKIERKLRSQLSTSAAKVTLRLPFLDNFKLSILGSLTILGLSGRR